MTELDRNSQMTRALNILLIVADYPRSTPTEVAQILRCNKGTSLHVRTVKRYLAMLQGQGLVEQTQWGWRATYRLVPIDPTNRNNALETT